MLSLIATVLVLAFLVNIVWPWLWHIVMTMALVLFVYIAWPWLQKPWEDLKSSWLQQIHASQLSPQRTDESRIHFEELGQEEYPRPYPTPILVDRWVEGGVLGFAAQRRTVSILLRRTRQTTVVSADAAERLRGAMQESRYR